MANHKRKKPRAKSVGCPCCHILNNNSAARTKPKDREIDEERTYPSRSQRPRPFAIEYRFIYSVTRGFCDWGIWKKYRTTTERAKALAVLSRTHPHTSFRIA